MAKSFNSLEDATEATYQYLRNEKAVHEITSKYGVNSFRLYGAIDGREWRGAFAAAIEKLKNSDPKAFSVIPQSDKVRRLNFSSHASNQLGLFG